MLAFKDFLFITKEVPYVLFEELSSILQNVSNLVEYQLSSVIYEVLIRKNWFKYLLLLIYA